MEQKTYNITFNMTDGTQEVIPFSVPLSTATDAQIEAAVANYLREYSITPLYAERIEDCSVSGAVYVLPDGYLYLPKYELVRGELFDITEYILHVQMLIYSNLMPVNISPTGEPVVMRLKGSRLNSFPKVTGANPPPYIETVSYYDKDGNFLERVVPNGGIQWVDGEATFVVGTKWGGEEYLGYRIDRYTEIAYVRFEIYWGSPISAVPADIFDSITVDGDAGLVRQCTWVNSGIKFLPVLPEGLVLTTEDIVVTLPDGSTATKRVVVLENTLISHLVTSELVDCYFSTAPANKVSDGNPLSCELKDSGRNYFNGSVRVTMGGQTITSDVVEIDNDRAYGVVKVDIPSVTGDVLIQCNWFDPYAYEEEEEDEEE